MFLSNAVVLLLGALQPALGTPAPQYRPADGTQNAIVSQWITGNETVINYFAPDPKCGDYSAWVGVWPADACNPYSADFKAWSYVQPTKGYKIATVKFSNEQLGPGEFKAAFVCEDGRRQPWMVSETVKIDMAPPAREGTCLHRRGIFNTAWTYTPCDKVPQLCFDCAHKYTCIACGECKEQCGIRNANYE